MLDFIRSVVSVLVSILSGNMDPVPAVPVPAMLHNKNI
jgi:hypothetical protein